MSKLLIKEKSKFHIYTLLFMIYFAIAPLEDVLSGSIGTLAKYVAVGIVLVAVLEKRMAFNIELNIGNFCVILLMLLSLLSIFWAIDNSAAREMLPTYLLVPGLCFFVSILDFSSKEYRLITESSIVGGVVTAIYIYAINSDELLAGDRLVLNELNDPNNLAALLLLPLVYSLTYFIMSKSKLLKIWYGFCMGLLVLLIFLTGSRGGLLAIVVFVCCFFVLNSKKKKIGTFFGILAAGVIVALVIMPLLPKEISERLFDWDAYFSASADGSGRIAIWKLAITEIIPKNILVGVGIGCSPVAIKEYIGAIKGVHNTYLNMVCETGIFGISFFLTMLLYRFREQYRLKQYAEAALLVGICASAFFLDAYPKKFLWNVLMLLVMNEKLIKSKLKDTGKTL